MHVVATMQFYQPPLPPKNPTYLINRSPRWSYAGSLDTKLLIGESIFWKMFADLLVCEEIVASNPDDKAPYMVLAFVLMSSCLPTKVPLHGKYTFWTRLNQASLRTLIILYLIRAEFPGFYLLTPWSIVNQYQWLQWLFLISGSSFSFVTFTMSPCSSEEVCLNKKKIKSIGLCVINSAYWISQGQVHSTGGQQVSFLFVILHGVLFLKIINCPSPPLPPLQLSISI